MSRIVAVELDADDDPVLALTATEDDVAYDFTGKVVELILKAYSTTPDVDALATLRSDGVSPKITISTTTASVDLAGLVDTAGSYWYRARVYEGSRKRTFLKGPLHVAPA